MKAILFLVLVSFSAQAQISKTIYRSAFDKAIEARLYELEKQSGLNVKYYGILPTNTGEQNSVAIEKLIASISPFSKISLFIPSGTYQFKRTIVIYNKGLKIRGGNNTVLWFDEGGFFISRSASMPFVYLENLDIKGRGKGYGISAHAIFHFTDVKVFYFEKGFNLTADIGTNKTDISHSSLTRCAAIENIGDGFYMQGGDANVIAFYSCDARDNGGIGFNDASFLGNHFYSCMGHENKKGHFAATDANNRSLFVGCYLEGGSPPSELHGAARVFGGITGFGAHWIKKSPWAEVYKHE